MNREVTVTSSLRRNFSWGVVGEVIYAGCQWAMVVAIAKLGSRELLGQFSLALAVTAPVLMFTNLQLRALQATDATPGGGFAKYFTLRLLSCGVALLVIGAVAGFANYPAETRAGILILGLAKVLEAVSDICHGRLQQLGNLKWVSLSLVLKGLLSLAAVAAGVYGTGRLVPVCLLLLLSWLAVLLAVDAPCVALAGGHGGLAGHGRETVPQRGPRPPFALSLEAGELMRLFRLGLPLGLTAMLISLNVSVPQFVLERYWHEGAVGVYRALASLMQLSNLPAAALGIAASSRLGYYFAARDRPGLRHLLTRLLGASFLFGAAGLVVSLVAGRFLLRVFYSPAYAEFRAAFAWLMLAALGVSLCYILNWAAMAARYVNVLIPLHLGVTAVTAATCFAWVPAWGVDGAAWGVAAASACQMAGMALILGHAVRSWSTAVA